MSISLSPYLSVWNISRHYAYGPSKAYLEHIIETYDLHELVEEDIMSRRTQDKIDTYDNCLFVVLHFPKYRPDLHRYMINEFNFILGSNYLITLTSYKTNHVEKVKNLYVKELETLPDDEIYKHSPYYIMYRLIDAMYDKVLHALMLFSQDVRMMEDDVFEKSGMNKTMLENIMIKRRNIVTLKHMLMPQEEILHEMHKQVQKFTENRGHEFDVYLEDLEYKLGRIMSTIETASEDVDSLYSTYSTLLNIRINSIITVLTIFASITGLMTLITGFYGMNVVLPFGDNPLAAVYILWWLVILWISMVAVFRYQKRI